MVWNKVSEGKLPEKDGEYLCCYKVYDEIIYKIYDYSDGNFFSYDGEYGEYLKQDVDAWMDFPKFKEDKIK